MSVLVARHGCSEANNRNNVGTLAFANEQAPLMDIGREQSRQMGLTLCRTFGVTPQKTAVATSLLARTQETASEAGFTDLYPYTVLNEDIHHLQLAELREMLDRGILPHSALETAEKVLQNPPQEKVWITHGLVIAGLCKVLDMYNDARLIPKFCEIRELPI